MFFTFVFVITHHAFGMEEGNPLQYPHMKIVSMNAFLESAKTFKGILLDADTKEPIQYGSIFYKNHQSTGTLSELDGRFSIRAIDQAETDTLVFRTLGYKNKYIPVKSIQSDFIEVYLNVQAVHLDEVAVVNDEYLKELLVKAIKHIPDNYPRKKHRLTGYFQELSITNGLYSHFLESYLTVENLDYKKKKNPVLSRRESNNKILGAEHKVKYHQIRRSDDNRIFSNEEQWYMGGSIYELLDGNFIYQKSLYGISGSLTHKDFIADVESIGRNHPQSNNNLEHPGDRLFNMGYQYNGEDTLAMIGLSSSFVRGKYGQKTDLLTTQIVINTSNYAIERIILSPTEKWTDADDSMYNSHQEIQYRKVDGKYYPSLIISKRGIDNDSEKHQEVSSIRFVVQEVQPSRKHFLDIKPTKYLMRGDRLVEKEYTYNQKFWKNYQIPEQMKASQVLKAELSREISLHDQFLYNQRRKHK